MSMQTKLSTLWIFVTLNTIYCDVTGSAFTWSETDVRPGLRDRESPASPR